MENQPGAVARQDASPRFAISMGSWPTRLFVAFVLTNLAGCRLLRPESREVTPATIDEVVLRSQSTHVVYVTGHGWHTGLVLRTDDIPASSLPEILDFQGSDNVEIGWGDEGVIGQRRSRRDLSPKPP